MSVLSHKWIERNNFHFPREINKNGNIIEEDLKITKTNEQNPTKHIDD